MPRIQVRTVESWQRNTKVSGSFHKQISKIEPCLIVLELTRRDPYNYLTMGIKPRHGNGR